MPEEQKQGFFSRFFDAADAYLESLFSSKNSFSQRRITTASNLWNYFDPDFPVLNQTGVCNGLVLDYARHTMRSEIKNQSKKTGKAKQGYAEKLARKFTVFGASSKNFAERVAAYQDILQVGNNSDSQHVKYSHDSIANKENKEFINVLNERIAKGEHLFGLTFNSSQRVQPYKGHIIAIRAIKKTNPQRYQIFDPNEGMYDCKDIESLQDKLNDLSKKYKLQGMDGEIGISNLGEVVTKSGLLENKLGKNLLEIQLGPRKLVRSAKTAIQELQDFLAKPQIEKSLFGFKETKKYDFEKIAAYISVIPSGSILAIAEENKLQQGSFKEIIGNLPNIHRNPSKEITQNILNICNIENPTSRLAELIDSRRAKEFPDLVLELIKKGANLTDKTHQKKFKEYFKITDTCIETAIYAIEQGNVELLKTLNEYCGTDKYKPLLSITFYAKSLLQIAKEKGDTQLVQQMEKYGFKLTQNELRAAEEAERKKAAEEAEKIAKQLDLEQRPFVSEALHKGKTNRLLENAQKHAAGAANLSAEAHKKAKHTGSILSYWFPGGQKGKLPEQETLLSGDGENMPQNIYPQSKQSSIRANDSTDELDQLLASVEASSNALLEETGKSRSFSKDTRTNSTSRSQNSAAKQKPWFRNPLKTRGAK